MAGLDGEAGTDDDGILSFGDQVDCYSHGNGDDTRGMQPVIGIRIWVIMMCEFSMAAGRVNLPENATG